MKLIDLLVQELPNRGGWPFGVGDIETHADGDIYFDGSPAPKEFRLPYCSDGWKTGFGVAYNNTVTKEQYESALAASQRTAWNGEGLPPIGCECELVNFFGNDFPDFTGEPGEVVKIIGNGFANGRPVAFYEADGGRGRVLAYAVEQCFSPIRTEAERKREEFAHACIAIDNKTNPSNSMEFFRSIYDAIAAGKIPGIRLE